MSLQYELSLIYLFIFYEQLCPSLTTLIRAISLAILDNLASQLTTKHVVW